MYSSKVARGCAWDSSQPRNCDTQQRLPSSAPSLWLPQSPAPRNPWSLTAWRPSAPSSRVLAFFSILWTCDAVTSHTSSAALPRPSPHYFFSTHLLMSFTHEPHTAVEQEGHSPTTAGIKSAPSNLSWCFDTSKEPASLLSCFSQFLSPSSDSHSPSAALHPLLLPLPGPASCFAPGVRCGLLKSVTGKVL